MITRKRGFSYFPLLLRKLGSIDLSENFVRYKKPTANKDVSKAKYRRLAESIIEDGTFGFAKRLHGIFMNDEMLSHRLEKTCLGNILNI